MRAFGMIGLLAVLAVGYYIYSAQIRQTPDHTPPARQINRVAVRQDLLSLAEAERIYMATHGRYAGLEELRRSGEVNPLPAGRQGYVYEDEVDGAAHFRITAKPVDDSSELPTLSIDETMQIAQ